MKPISSDILKNSSKAWKPRSITFGDAVVDDQAVHQLHLAEGVVDLGGLGQLRQVVEQRRLFQIDVERDHRAALAAAGIR